MKHIQETTCLCFTFGVLQQGHILQVGQLASTDRSKCQCVWLLGSLYSLLTTAPLSKKKNESGQSKSTFAEKVLIAKHYLGHFSTPSPISLYFPFFFPRGGQGGCASDTKNGVDWNSVRVTLSLLHAWPTLFYFISIFNNLLYFFLSLSHFPIPTPFLVDTHSCVFDLHK